MSTPTHFKGKDAIGHVVEAQAQGIVDSAEIHGTELPGYLSAATDAAKETAIALLFVWSLLLALNTTQIFLSLAIFACGWLTWKCGRSAWLGWSRLERLHRVLEQEKWEIEHHRTQERSELKELYAAKGFQGKLLEDVLDVLMADNERLLRVMVQEELGLSLEAYEHPLKQSLGAGVGSILASLTCIGGLFLLPSYGIVIAAALVLGISAALSAYYVGNHRIPAVIWMLGIGALSFGVMTFLIDYLLG